jgi:transcriptional regulator with XRE-family HTH domain
MDTLLNVSKRALMLSSVATLGQNLKRLRERAGFDSQIEFARAIGASSQQVSDWENDRRDTVDLATIVRLAKGLKCSVEELVQGVDLDYDRVNRRARNQRRLEDVERVVAALNDKLSRSASPPDAWTSRFLRQASISVTQAREHFDSGWDDLTIEQAGDTHFDITIRNAEESLAALRSEIAGEFSIAGTEFHDADVVTDLDVATGYKPDDLPVVAEGEASPQANLFWDDQGKLTSDVEERISRPFDVSDPRAYGVKVRGDSMMPRYKPGEVLVVSPNTPVEDGDEVYVALLSGERLLKIARKAQGGWILESENRAYPARFVKKSEIGTMHPVMWIRPKRRRVGAIDDSGRRTAKK